MTKIYYDSDADIDVLKGKVIAIIGYGNQGRAQALNMRDSGVEKIIVGSIKDDSSHIAHEDGFEVMSIGKACKKADIIFMLIPDEVAPKVYEEEIAPTLKAGDAVNFASGYNITYKNIKPAKDLDVIMCAPRMIGKGVRELYEKGDGAPVFIAVEQDATGKAKEVALALAKAMGGTKKGAIEVTFKDETYLDLTAEQAVWPLIMTVLTETFKFQVEKGHPEEAVLMELYLSKEPMVMMEKMADMGLFKQLPFHSHTSQYGQLTGFADTNKKVIREFIEKQYSNIESGRFAEIWKRELENDLKDFKGRIAEAYNSDITRAEERVKSRLK
jgi:ketol-acid reductoisomerase